VLAARIDRLSPADKALLQTASVVGKDMPLALLQAIAGLAEDELYAAIGRLQAAEFLYETSLFPDVEYTFKHALTNEVAYGSLLQDRRRCLHGQIVEAIERLYPARLAEHVERLAHHAFRAETWGKGVTYLRQAGAKAFARSANREALADFEQALTALSHLPESRETMERAIDVRFELRTVLLQLAQFARMDACLREAETLARTLNDQRRLGWVSAYMSGTCLATGRHVTEARTLAQRVGTIGEALGDLPLEVAAQYYLLYACHLSGDYLGAEHVGRRLMQSLQGERARERFGLLTFPAVQSRECLARAFAERGVFDEANAHGHEAIQIAEELDQHPFSLTWACLSLGRVHNVKGELRQAVHLFERAVAECRDWDVPFLSPFAMAWLGHAYACSGRVVDGVSLLQQAVTAHESEGNGHLQSMSVVQLGETYLLADRVEEARACADRAVGLARERGERGHEAWALRLLGEIASRHDHSDVATAEAHYRAAMTLASELGMRPLLAHCHLGVGKLYRRTSDQAKAHEELTTATAMYRKMDMIFWLDRAGAE
jgi:tetratricopeptide (TPR) repeat protein